MRAAASREAVYTQVSARAADATRVGDALPYARRFRARGPSPTAPAMTKPKTTHFDTLSLHAGARPTRRPARARRRSTSRRRSCSRTATTPRRCSTWSAPATSIRGSPIRPARCSRSAIAALEGGVGAIATASGQAALHLAIVTLLGAGAHIVASRALYGGSHNLLDYTLPRFGDRDDVRRSARPRRLARGDPSRDAAPVRRDARQSRARRARHPARRGARARARPAAARRLDVHHAVSDAAVRARRRPRLPLGDQVPVRPRRRDRRPARRFGAVRLGRRRRRAASSRR